MINFKIKTRTYIVLFTLAAMSVASVYVFQSKASAAGLKGKIFTTTFDGQEENHFSSKDAVYLAGVPQNQNHALPDGAYYFQVTGPSGNDLLSTDLAVCRQLIVFNGVIAAADGPSCQHPTGIPESADGSTPVKLAPFADTSNPGGVNKVWLIQQGGGTTVASDGKHINFSNSTSLTENFKADSVTCTNCAPTSLLAGREFYDVNANSIFDNGEVPIAGVQVFVGAGSTGTVLTTSSSGVWSISVPTGTEYFVEEYVPFTGADEVLGSYWQQTFPLPADEGLRIYRGTVNGDLLNLNFGNICFNPDIFGHPIAKLTPCSVSDRPPPEPTPQPTPTPCPDCATTAVLSGTKFYDGNKNAFRNEGEVSIQGVQIAVVLTTSDGTSVNFATTNADGNWSMTVPVGAQYIISEYLPDTDPELESGPYTYWDQTGPTANEEGFRGYAGTVSEDQGGFDFGNVCYHTDSLGNPIESSTPCSVRYPPPPPTPTPTPDNQ